MDSGSGGDGLGVKGRFDGELVLVSEPIEDQLDQFVDRSAAMVAGDFFVEMPPHALDRVRLGSIRGQEMKRDPVSPPREKLVDQAAVVELGVVADDMNVPIATQSFSQIVQMFDEQLRVALLARRTHQQLRGS